MLAEIVLMYVNISLHFDAIDSRAAAINTSVKSYED